LEVDLPHKMGFFVERQDIFMSCCPRAIQKTRRFPTSHATNLIKFIANKVLSGINLVLPVTNKVLFAMNLILFVINKVLLATDLILFGRNKVLFATNLILSAPNNVWFETDLILSAVNLILLAAVQTPGTARFSRAVFKPGVSGGRRARGR
jgi:hypothetical protein